MYVNILFDLPFVTNLIGVSRKNCEIIYQNIKRFYTFIKLCKNYAFLTIVLILLNCLSIEKKVSLCYHSFPNVMKFETVKLRQGKISIF